MNTWKVEVSDGVLVHTVDKIIVGHRYGRVLLKINTAILEFTTPEAFRLGWELVVKPDNLTKSGFVTVTFNQKDVQLTTEQSKRLGGAILRKCDLADDFQIGVRL